MTFSLRSKSEIGKVYLTQQDKLDCVAVNADW